MAGVKGKSGRKKRSYRRAAVSESVSITASWGAGYILACLSGKIEVKDIDWRLVDLSKFAINHVLGLPKQKTEVTGKDGMPLLPYPELVAMAMAALNRPPESPEVFGNIGVKPVADGHLLLKNPDETGAPPPSTSVLTEKKSSMVEVKPEKPSRPLGIELEPIAQE